MKNRMLQILPIHISQFAINNLWYLCIEMSLNQSPAFVSEPKRGVDTDHSRCNNMSNSWKQKCYCELPVANFLY